MTLKRVQIGDYNYTEQSLITFLDRLEGGQTHISEYNFVSEVMAIALHYNRTRVIDLVFDWFKIPCQQNNNVLTLKERLAMLMLLENIV